MTSIDPGAPRSTSGALAARLALLLPAALWGCALGSGALPPSSPPAAPESVWEALLKPRPQPLEGAVRVSIAELLLLEDPWGVVGPLPGAMGLEELVAAGLLRRTDVHFVERRRFAEAAERERRGLPQPPGAPPVGVSPGAEYLLAGSWAPSGPDSAYLDLRLVRAGTGDVAMTIRRATPRQTDPVGVARAIAGGLLEALAAGGMLPEWRDPLPEAAPRSYRASGVPLGAVEAFFRGVGEEDRYDWESARRSYQEARSLGGPGFVEAEEALARVARLRSGGTLGTGEIP